MNRIFLSWDRPACHAVAERLLALGEDVHRHLVLVPTRESGRQLRELLAAASPGQAAFSPRVMPADQFLQPEERDDEATSPEELAAWTLALGNAPHQHYPRLFPNPMPQDTASRLDMAAALHQLHLSMLRQGITCGQASAACSGMDDRWHDLETLFTLGKTRLSGWHLRDRSESFLHPAPASQLTQVLLETGGSIITACVPDVPHPLQQALRQAEEAGIPVQCWVHAPEEERDSFDSWGRPLPEVWAVRPIPVRADHIRVTPSADGLAAETCRLIAETAHEDRPDVALGVCDPDMNVALNARLRQYGWGLHHPEGRPFAGTGIMDMLKHLQRAMEEEDQARPVYNLMRSALLCTSLGIDNQPACCAVLDEVRQTFLPETEAYLMTRLQERNQAAAASVRTVLGWRDRMKEENRLGERLLEWLPAMAAACGPDSEALQHLQTAAAGLARLQRRSTAFARPADALPLLLQCLKGLRVKSGRKEHAALDALGWMELHFRPERHLIVTGLNEGIVPEGGVADQFMPEGLKTALSADSFAGKKARDSFLLTALLHSRKREGSLHIVLSRTGSKNDPLTPSSLLMRCTDEELPQRVEQLFREHSVPTPPLPYRRGNWHLKPGEGWREGWREGKDISSLAPGFRNPWKEKRQPFSPSVLKRFLACPMRFWLREALHMREDDFQQDKEGMAANELGTMLHAVLEQFCQNNPSLKDGMTVATLQREVDAVLEETFLRQYGPRPLMPLLLQKKSMEQRLAVFAEQHLQTLRDGWACIDFERQVEGWQLGGFPMKFRIDRIDRHADGALRVIDYKTGSAAPCEKRHLESMARPDALPLLSPALTPYTRRQKNGKAIHHRWKDLQLPIYVLWVMEEYGGQPAAAHYALPANPADTALSMWDTLHETLPGCDTDALDSAQAWATELMRLIRDGRGLITAEELGWPTPPYDVFNGLLRSGTERLQDLLGLDSTPHLPF